MNIRTWEKLTGGIIALALISSLGLRAQTISIPPLTISSTGTNPVDFEFRADGTVIAEGNYGVGSLLSTDQGAGTRMLWFPDLAAFRAGGVTGTQWDVTSNNIGAYSIAMGYNPIASGSYSTAIGNGAESSSSGSIALGNGSDAAGAWSVAMGMGATAIARESVAIGPFTIASGAGSIAIGYQTLASSGNAMAFGCGTIASGELSTSFGNVTTAASFESFVIGTYNLGGGDATSWVATDPLFEVGNGTSIGPSDALEVFKNGSVTIQGPLTAQQGVLTTAASVANTDIPMYTGN